MLNNSVQWEKFVYLLSLADNGKDISASYEYSGRDYISQSLAAMTMLAMNKSELEKADLDNKLNNAIFAYSENDGQLNNLWKSLPESVRASMKKNRISGLTRRLKDAGRSVMRLLLPRLLRQESRSISASLKEPLKDLSIWVEMKNDSINAHAVGQSDLLIL